MTHSTFPIVNGLTLILNAHPWLILIKGDQLTKVVLGGARSSNGPQYVSRELITDELPVSVCLMDSKASGKVLAWLLNDVFTFAFLGLVPVLRSGVPWYTAPPAPFMAVCAVSVSAKKEAIGESSPPRLFTASPKHN